METRKSIFYGFFFFFYLQGARDVRREVEKIRQGVVREFYVLASQHVHCFAYLKHTEKKKIQNQCKKTKVEFVIIMRYTRSTDGLTYKYKSRYVFNMRLEGRNNTFTRHIKFS